MTETMLKPRHLKALLEMKPHLDIWSPLQSGYREAASTGDDTSDGKMEEATQIKEQTISVMVDGRHCYQKVTKNTTCEDVIQHLLKYIGLNKNNKASYFLFASNNIIEKQLSNKIKILKVAEDLMSGTNRIHFILRKKTHRFIPKASIVERSHLRKKSAAKELKVANVKTSSFQTSKDAPLRVHGEEIRGFKRFSERILVQKRRLNEVCDKLQCTAKIMKRSTEMETSFKNDHKPEYNLDQFLSNVNEENMQGFLSFCDKVATKEMENTSSAFPSSSSVDRSIMDGHMRLMQCKFDRQFVDHVMDTLDGKLSTTVKEISQCKFSTAEDITKDIIILEDELYYGDKGQGRFPTMSLPLSQRLADPNRIRRDAKLLHSTPLANKTMTYLNKSRNRNRMMRKLTTSRLSQGQLTTLEQQKVPRCNSNMPKRGDGDLSMFISHSKPVLSRPQEKCKYFWEHNYVMESDVSLEHTDLEDLNDAFVNTSDASKNDSTHSASPLDLLSIVLNDNTHSTLVLGSSSCVLPRMPDVQEEAIDRLSEQNLKMSLVNYSSSESDTSSMSCETDGILCNCSKTLTRDYVTNFGYSPESRSDTGLSSFGSDDQEENSF